VMEAHIGGMVHIGTLMIIRPQFDQFTFYTMVCFANLELVVVEALCYLSVFSEPCIKIKNELEGHKRLAYVPEGYSITPL